MQSAHNKVTLSSLVTNVTLEKCLCCSCPVAADESPTVACASRVGRQRRQMRYVFESTTHIAGATSAVQAEGDLKTTLGCVQTAAGNDANELCPAGRGDESWPPPQSSVGRRKSGRRYQSPSEGAGDAFGYQSRERVYPLLEEWWMCPKYLQQRWTEDRK